MSVPEPSENAWLLKAPPGMYRVVQIVGYDLPEAEQQQSLVDDYRSREVAFDVWRALLKVMRGTKTSFKIINSDGREVGILGIRITEEADKKAPAGQFRLVCVDAAYMHQGKPTLWHRCDIADRSEAIQAALNSDDGPFTGMIVCDETGSVLQS